MWGHLCAGVLVVGLPHIGGVRPVPQEQLGYLQVVFGHGEVERRGKAVAREHLALVHIGVGGQEQLHSLEPAVLRGLLQGSAAALHEVGVRLQLQQPPGRPELAIGDGEAEGVEPLPKPVREDSVLVVAEDSVFGTVERQQREEVGVASSAGLVGALAAELEVSWLLQYPAIQTKSCS